jgi:GGDEF domain-containing protein
MTASSKASARRCAEQKALGTRAARRVAALHQVIRGFDPLTSLPGRRFLLAGSQVLKHGPVSVALLDLDGFKGLSYEQGRHLLQELAGVLQRICRRGDAVIRPARRFVIVLRTCGDASRRVLLIANRPWRGLPPSTQVTASIGVGVGADDMQRAGRRDSTCEAKARSHRVPLITARRRPVRHQSRPRPA